VRLRRQLRLLISRQDEASTQEWFIAGVASIRNDGREMVMQKKRPGNLMVAGAF